MDCWKIERDEADETAFKNHVERVIHAGLTGGAGRTEGGYVGNW